MLHRTSILTLLFVFLTLSCTSNENPEYSFSNTKHSSQYHQVSKIVDGDTFWIDDGSAKGLKIRLIGIDAPESRRTFKKEIGHFGKEAKEYLSNMISGKRVKLEFDVKKLDQYGRTLAYAYLEDNSFINAELIKNGYATLMTVPPNVKYVDQFIALQKEAREAGRGLWKEQ